MLTGFAASRDLVNRVKQAARQIPPPIMAARVREVLSTDCSEALAKYPGPILCIAGSHDRIVSANGWSRFLPGHPNARRIIMEGPHLLLETRPNAVLQEIKMMTFDGQS